MPLPDALGEAFKTPEQTAQTARPWQEHQRPLGNMTPEQLNAQLRSNPRFQAWLQRTRGNLAGQNRDPRGGGMGLEQALSEAGLPTELPQDYSFDLDRGEVTRDSFMERNPWVSGLLAAAGPATAGLAGVGAVGGAGAVSGAGGGAGAGTLAATPAAFTGAGFAPAVTPALGAGASAGVGAGVGAGGGSMGWGSILSRLASDPNTYATLAGQLGRIGEGQAGERGAENEAAASADRLRTNIFGTEGNIFGTQQSASSHAADARERGTLDRAQLGIAAPSARARQALLGSLIQNVQPVSFGNLGRVRVPTMTGGLTPAAISEATRGAGGELERQAIDALLSKSDIPEATDFQSALVAPPTAPEPTPYREPGRGESILSGIGATGNTLQAILENLSRQSRGQQNQEQPEMGGG